MEDFIRLVSLLLPTFLRRDKMVAFLRALIGIPLQNRQSNYMLFSSASRYDASITPQLCSLRHAITQKWDVNCDIIELDGKPYDFLVELDRSSDVKAIEAFLLKFGLAGKTFTFNLADTIYSVTWDNYVEEDLVENYSVEWMDHQFEDNGEVFLYPIVLANADTGWVVSVSTLQPMPARVTVVVYVNYWDDNHSLAQGGGTAVTLEIGDKNAQQQITLTEGSKPPFEITASVYPNKSGYYTFIIENTYGTNR